MGIKYLDGAMVPRAVARHVDHRCEPRVDTPAQAAVVWLRGRRHPVQLLNLSASGAMFTFRLIPHIGETIRIELSGHGDVSARVCWVRDGHVGVSFAAPLACAE
ncbi:PilZ domain-containing protein [Sphingomonas sabuli]|uniref:PilZ domain-containing protein n=1 Tax=Sphingomonas sabuli TaxID=2764186 RepID=A0A7G9L098_9SPHN|nr:PilZ domain-containing protein [Sphingomonas sabuli]QNM82047.1 PilZ domain-containing protein [Sphingomonas sabuli]